MTKTIHKFAGMRPVAQSLIDALSPACERIEIAGSLRRGHIAVSDIELVAIPKIKYVGIFADQEDSQLDDQLIRHSTAKTISKISGGDKAKAYMVNSVKPPIKLDLFVANLVNWGLIMAIRTGPAEYSKKLVTQRSKGGLLDDSYRVKDGYLWKCIKAAYGYPQDQSPSDVIEAFDDRAYKRIVTETEESFFEHIAGGWVAPERRLRCM